MSDYQYINLSEIIADYQMSRDTDDITSTVPRYKILYQAKRGIREFYFDVLKDIRGVEYSLSPSLNIELPPDYVNYVRISWVDDNNMLHPLAVNNSLSLAKPYLQDSQGNILFDNAGRPVFTENEHKEIPSRAGCYSFQPNKNMSSNSKYFYRVDKTEGIIQFSSDVPSGRIVLEYISDGLFEYNNMGAKDIKVHKFVVDALLDFIYYELIKNRRNVAYNEKHRARKEFYNSKRRAKRKINTLRYKELIQIFKGDSKWIK